MEVSALIPAYNEEDSIGGVVREVRELVDEVVVVDDWSADGAGDSVGGSRCYSSNS